MEISVIMPVCNAERTLRRAIDSALLQATSLEVLCVDDGSTDNSADILREYALREPRVRAIFTRRRGPGAARIPFPEKILPVGKPSASVGFRDETFFLRPRIFIEPRA